MKQHYTGTAVREDPPAQANGTLDDAIDSPSRVQIPAWLVFVLVLLLAAAYTYSRLKIGWLPEDDGVLANSALRVLQGQLPHRDFVEVYTGGLDFIHAAAFRLFGVNLVSLRLCLFIFFLGWLPAIFFIARRFFPATGAGAVTLLAAAWSISNYPTPMPSWYNLFCAVYGAAALLRYIETENRRWLFFAGLCGGVSFLVKVIGLYYVAAVLLFFVFREQVMNSGAKPSCSGWLYRAFSIAGLLAFPAAIVIVMRQRFDDREFIQFLLPSAALVALLVWREFRLPASASSGRFATLFRMAVPFGLGMAVPLVLFLAPYGMSGSLRVFSAKVIGGTAAHVQALGIRRPESGYSLILAAVLVAIVAAASFWQRARGLVLTIIIGAAGTLLLVLCFRTDAVAQAIWSSAALSTPLFVTLGAALLLVKPPEGNALSAIRQQQVMLLLAVAAVCSLVQFPFAAPIYFCYFAPTLALAVGAIVSMKGRPGNPALLMCVLALYTLFAVGKVTPGVIYDNAGFKSAPVEKRLGLPRAGGLAIEHTQFYEAAYRTVMEHAGNGIVLATPDCPDVYFLTGLRNPLNNDNALPPQQILNTIRNNALRVIVINPNALFSRASVTPEVIDAVAAQFPNRVQIGKYWVCWR